MCIHNESLNLEECINHLDKYVDKFVVFDDESTDNSIEILKKFPKVAEIITEKQMENINGEKGTIEKQF